MQNAIKGNVVEGTIGFGADKELLEDFQERVELLGVTKSEFARRAYLLGRKLAADQLREERLLSTGAMLEKLRNITFVMHSHSAVGLGVCGR